MAQTPVVIEQRILAGSQFTEQTPATVPVDSKAVRVFPADIQGGEFIFDFQGPDASFVTYVIEQIFVDFGDAAFSEVAIKDSVGNRAVIASPGAGVFIRVDPVKLAWDQKLTLKTGAPGPATTALFARVQASPERIKQE